MGTTLNDRRREQAIRDAVAAVDLIILDASTDKDEQEMLTVAIAHELTGKATIAANHRVLVREFGIVR